MLSKSILQKIQKVTAEVPSLVKGDNAPQAGFNYVSIDTYYEEVAKLAYATGLVWIIREEAIEIAPYGDHGLVQVQTYEVDLYDTETGDGCVGVIKASISHPFVEAQTTGSSVSYLDKLVMRQLFKVVTGEKDADHFAKGRKAQGGTNAASKPSQAEAPTGQKNQETRPTTKKVVDKIEETFDSAGEEGAELDGDSQLDADEIASAFKRAGNKQELSQARLLHDEGVRQLKKLALNSNDWADKLAIVQAAYKSKFNELNGAG
jgi:hypothetical protein